MLPSKKLIAENQNKHSINLVWSLEFLWPINFPQPYN